MAVVAGPCATSDSGTTPCMACVVGAPDSWDRVLAGANVPSMCHDCGHSSCTRGEAMNMG